MKTKKVIEVNTDDLNGMNFLFYSDDENGWFINDEDSIKEAIKEYGDDFPQKLLYDIHVALQYLAESVAEHISKDLKDIWERLDEIENK